VPRAWAEALNRSVRLPRTLHGPESFRHRQPDLLGADSGPAWSAAPCCSSCRKTEPAGPLSAASGLVAALAQAASAAAWFMQVSGRRWAAGTLGRQIARPRTPIRASKGAAAGAAHTRKGSVSGKEWGCELNPAATVLEPAARLTPWRVKTGHRPPPRPRATRTPNPQKNSHLHDRFGAGKPQFDPTPAGRRR